MELFLETINRSEEKEQFIGNNSRLATCTGVKIIDDNHLIATHFVGKKMYLFKYDLLTNHYEVIDTIDTTFKDDLITTDLLDYCPKTNRILTSNADRKSVSLYSVDLLNTVKKLIHIRDYEEENVGFCHGVKFYPYDSDIFVATSHKPDNCVYFKSFTTSKVIMKISCKPYLPKDLCFPAANRIIFTVCERFPAKRPGVFYKVEINHYSFDLETGKHVLLDNAMIKPCHTDSCTYSHQLSRFYLTGGLDNTIIVYRLSNNKLEFDKVITGFNFPHGVDVRDDVLAVTNYGSNSVILKKL